MIADPVATVNALAVDAALALFSGTFPDVAPRLREAMAACPRDRRLDIVISRAVLAALVAPAIARLGAAGFITCCDAFVERAGGDLARALAEFLFAAAVGEVGFDA